MRLTRLLGITGVAVYFLTCTALTKLVFAENPVPKAKDSQKVERLRTKVIRLVCTDPKEVQQVMERLLEFIPSEPVVAPQPMLISQPGGAPAGNFGISADARTRSIIVRGTEKHLQMAADLVAVLDQPTGKDPMEVKSLRAVSLKHAKPQELVEVIEQLALDCRVVSLPAVKMLIFTGSDQVMEDLAEVIAELDVPTPPEPKKDEKKKLFEEPRPEM